MRNIFIVPYSKTSWLPERWNFLSYTNEDEVILYKFSHKLASWFSLFFIVDDVYRDFLGIGGIEELPGFELDHRNMEYGSINTTFAWKILPPGSECSMSQIISYPQCQLNNPDIDITTPKTRYTIASTRLYISGQLADFHLSSLSEQESVQCVGLDEIVRINGNAPYRIWTVSLCILFQLIIHICSCLAI